MTLNQRDTAHCSKKGYEFQLLEVFSFQKIGSSRIFHSHNLSINLNSSMAKIQGPNEGKTYYNIYKDKRAHT